MRLGVNIDHVATIRNARGGKHPDPVKAAHEAIAAGADGITAHLREDRRHIRDEDIRRLRAEITAPLNLEMAATDEMVALACTLRPHACCIVPEKRSEITTEGGLDVIGQRQLLMPKIAALKHAGIRVSLFVAPDPEQLSAAAQTGADVVELHTGAYADHAERELDRLTLAAAQTTILGLECHAGHGLTYKNVGAIARISEVRELNIGHFIIGEAIFTGLRGAIEEMRRRIEKAGR